MRPTRQQTRAGQTYFVTSQTWQRRALFKNPQWANLFLETLQAYRGRAYLLHEYVLMPDHFHILITPSGPLERAVQFIKGGFSFRVKKELESSMEIWQTGFSDHRVRNAEDYRVHVDYVLRNPVGKRLVETATEYPYCSAFPGSLRDEVPQWLKPPVSREAYGAAEAAPLRTTVGLAVPEAAAPRENSLTVAPKGAPLQNHMVLKD